MIRKYCRYRNTMQLWLEEICDARRNARKKVSADLQEMPSDANV
jgi:hypothetical protein